jgi:hypothetical protein
MQDYRGYRRGYDNSNLTYSTDPTYDPSPPRRRYYGQVTSNKNKKNPPTNEKKVFGTISLILGFLSIFLLVISIPLFFFGIGRIIFAFSSMACLAGIFIGVMAIVLEKGKGRKMGIAGIVISSLVPALIIFLLILAIFSGVFLLGL